MANNIEDIILRGLIYEEDFMRKTIPYIKGDYFTDSSHKHIFKTINEYVESYNKRPTVEALEIEIGKLSNVSESLYSEINTSLKEYKGKATEILDNKWLTENTEKWCKHRSVANAVYECITILEDDNKKLSMDSMPDILKEALGVSFDQSVGHDLIADAEERYDFYNTDIKRLPFKIDLLNKITGGGIPRKTLNLLMGATGGFKSGTMCSFAADYLLDGQNVLYVTLELAEERVAERIDANLLDITLDDLRKLPKNEYVKRINDVKSKTVGRMIIKEYPTSSAHTGHIRHLLRELELKKNFKPDVIVVDYLNIMTSSRTSMAAGSYTYVKAIAEELRGLAVEFDVPIWTATQTNRGGYDNSDLTLENASESAGVASTVDLFLALINTEELQERGQLMVKQLKNRFGDLNKFNKFVVGKDGGKMRVFDVEKSAQIDFNKQPMPNKSSSECVQDAMKSPFEERTQTTASPLMVTTDLSEKRDKFNGFKFDD